MFNPDNYKRRDVCMACKEVLDEEDTSSFVSIRDNEFKNLKKPLVAFFLYSGGKEVKSPSSSSLTPHPNEKEEVSDKICSECYETLKNINKFYTKCKNSKNQYTPCFGSSSASSSSLLKPIEQMVVQQRGTPRVLSTETPDLDISTIEASQVRFKSSSPSTGIGIAIGPENPEMRSDYAQCGVQDVETQVERFQYHKLYPLRHDLGIKLPVPQNVEPGDLCYAMLKEEFELNETQLKRHPSYHFPGSAINIPPAKKSFATGHIHFSQCPFCPSLIYKKNPFK